MTRKFITLAALLALVPFVWTPAEARYASIVVDGKSGRVLHAINPDTKKHPASLAKMMTLYLVFEALKKGKLKLGQRLRVSRVAASRSPSKLGLKRGERIKVRDVIGALITKSANDAATVMAEALAGTERKFGRMMTKKARALGMFRTTFRNASGLPHYQQRTTARDMATLSRAMIRDFPNHYQRFSRQSFNFRGRTFRNHNRLLTRYKGVDGIKTGYIRASGFNLAASAERNGRRIIAVVFGGKSPKWRDAHVARLMDQGFARLGPSRKTMIARAEDARNQFTIRPAMARPTPLMIEPESGWAIQVGAYKRYAPAHLAVMRAARAVPQLHSRQVTIIPDEAESGRVYRARLVGLSERVARISCRELKQKNIACIVVPSDVSLAQGSQ